MIRILIIVAGLLLAGCLDPSYARLAGMLRYDGNDARGDTYVACTVADNSSFEALDACMAKSGYSRKDR